MATLKYLSQYFSTTLNVGGGIDASQTTGIILQSVSGVHDITEPGQICITYSDPIDTSVAEWIDYTSINGSNELVGAVRGREGFSAHTHLQGATVAFVLSASHHNDVVDLLNGTEAGIKVKTAIYDENGNEVIKTPATTSAVNEVTVTNSATGTAVQVSATGDDTNIDLKLVPKGTGGILDKNDEYLSPNLNLYRNSLTNPNFDVWQVLTSYNNVGTSKYTADTWFVDSIGATYTVSQQDGTGVTGSRYCIRMARNAGSTATDAMVLRQALETVDSIKLRGKKLTLSFWARKGADYSHTNSNIVVEIRSTTSSDQAPNFSGDAEVSTTKALTTTWTRYSVTTTAAIGTTINQIGIDIYGVPTGTAGAADYFEVTQAILNVGDVALQFQPRDYADEEKRCQRIRFVPDTTQSLSHVAIGGNSSTTNARCLVNLPVEMRIAPTLTVTASDFAIAEVGGTNIACTAIAILANQASKYTVGLSCDVASGLTAYRPCQLRTTGVGKIMVFSAEL